MAEKVSLPEVPHKSLREAAYVAIREAIASGQFKPGQRLVEKALAQQLGISRAPVREALRQLESEGLVVGRPHRGVYVAELSSEDVWEIYTLRAAVEGLAVRLVARQVEPEVVEELGDLVRKMRVAAERGRREELSQLDMRFHEVLCRAASHRRLLEAWQSMYAQARMLVSMIALREMLPARLVRHHEEVTDAIRRGDPAEAERLLTSHILAIGERVVATSKLDGQVDAAGEGAGETDSYR